MKINRGKEGVTLSMLAITIVVMVIIASVTVINVGSAINDTKKVTFVSDLKAIEDEVSLYYLQYHKLPKKGEVLSEKEVLQLSGDSNSNLLREEFRQNGDDKENLELGSFYQLDLQLLPVESTKRGLEKEGKNDIYIVSYPSLKVYYLAGISADNTKYFSLTTKLTDMVYLKTEPSQTEETQVELVNGIMVKKEKNTWSNKMGIIIYSFMESDEKLYMSIAGGKEKEIKTTLGMNQLAFQSLQEIKEGKSSIKVSMTENDVSSFDQLPSTEKRIEIIKRKGEIEIAREKIDLSNYEKKGPVFSDQVLSYYNETDNMFSFSVSDEESGVSEVYYEYLYQYDEQGKIQSYYQEVDEYDPSYMKTRAKKIKVLEKGNYQIKVPRNIVGVQITAFDYAGNATSKKMRIEHQTVTKIVAKNVVEDQVSFQFIVSSKKEIVEIKTYISIDGVHFEEEKNIAIEDPISFYEGVGSYEKIISPSENIYVKIIVLDQERKEEVVIINLKDISAKIKS